MKRLFLQQKIPQILKSWSIFVKMKIAIQERTSDIKSSLFVFFQDKTKFKLGFHPNPRGFANQEMELQILENFGL